MKNGFWTNGPSATAFSVYEDFMSYKGGVYKINGTSPRVKVDGKDMGHAFCVVGYDESKEAWRRKNSWGSGWGMGGYCYIGYGECGIDAQMWGVSDLSTIYPFIKAAGKPSVCIYSGQTHYCYRDTNGDIWDVIWTGSNWTAQQVTGTGGQTDGPAAVGDPAVVVYSGTGFNQMHYFYRDLDGNIWDADGMQQLDRDAGDGQGGGQPTVGHQLPVT